MSKELSRPAMMKWVSKTMKFVKPSEQFREDFTGAIWLSAEGTDTYKGRQPYDYWNESSSYCFGTLEEWEEEVKKRGWFSEFEDAGTVFLMPL